MFFPTLRNKLTEEGEILPNQIKLPSKQPTLRWVFQLMEGVSLVTLSDFLIDN
ncbi:hypothetical protein LDG_6858 [Legionella drancourtii LLAP12]|uniref:Uncharacterized protein n=1 Tax=Legionella drancourtii LLAP12 TaxID=658187 RepID=G9ENN3_9GAMM|nr:hypothetical protein LDG_6858 [Legionella drancourtii LLAP12]